MINLDAPKCGDKHRPTNAISRYDAEKVECLLKYAELGSQLKDMRELAPGAELATDGSPGVPAENAASLIM